jgi:hypothetical protein
MLGMTKARMALPFSLMVLITTTNSKENAAPPFVISTIHTKWKRHPPLCHPERSRGICSSLNEHPMRMEAPVSGSHGIGSPPAAVALFLVFSHPSLG